MNTLRQSLWIGIAATCLAFGANAQDFKIGFVNTDRIFREASSAKAAQAKLEQEFSRREKELVETGNALKTGSEKFEREAPTLSESQRAARQGSPEGTRRILKAPGHKFEPPRTAAAI